MKYYVDIPYFPAPKNKLCTAVEAVIYEYNRLVFSPNLLPVIQSSIVNVINQLNKEYPRCKPFETKWSEDNARRIGGGSIIINDKKLKDWTLFFTGGMYSHCAMILKICREETDL